MSSSDYGYVAIHERKLGYAQQNLNCQIRTDEIQTSGKEHFGGPQGPGGVTTCMVLSQPTV
jgi:hypothetical protein